MHFNGRLIFRNIWYVSLNEAPLIHVLLYYTAVYCITVLQTTVLCCKLGLAFLVLCVFSTQQMKPNKVKTGHRLLKQIIEWNSMMLMIIFKQFFYLSKCNAESKLVINRLP